MAILTALFGFLGRQAGRLVNVIFGWTTIALFGRVPARKQTWLSVIALGAIAWLVALVGTGFPRVGTFLIAFAPIPSWVNPSWVRLAMLVAVIILPLTVGVISNLVIAEQRPTGRNLVVSLLRGYPYCLGLSATLLLMCLFVPFMKIPVILRRWEDEHLPMIVKPERYEGVVTSVQAALSRAGIETRKEQAPLLVRLPPKILAALGGKPVQGLVADQMTMLKGKRVPLEILLYPSDLMVRGEAAETTRARAAVVKQAAFSDAYFTWTKEGNELEQHLLDFWTTVRDHRGPDLDLNAAMKRLRGFEGRLGRSKLAFEEWGALYREVLQVETAILQAALGLAENPEESAQRAQKNAA